MRQAAAIFGRAVMTTLPLISALALRFLMLMPPICLATLPPSSPLSASPTAPVAFADSEPVTLSVPVSGVASDNTSWAPVAVIGPREAVQPMSAFSRICEIGLSALPLKLRGALRSAASRIADSAIATGAITVDARGAAGSGGNSTSVGARTSPRGATKSKTFRLTTNETTMTATAIAIVLGCIGRRIGSPIIERSRAFYREGGRRASARPIKPVRADAFADRRSRAITLICRAASMPRSADERGQRRMRRLRPVLCGLLFRKRR